MRANLVIALSCLVLGVFCEKARDNEIQVDDIHTPSEEGVELATPEATATVDQGDQEQLSSDSETVRKRNEQILAQLAEEERRRLAQEDAPIEDSVAKREENLSSARNDQESASPKVDLTSFEKRLSELVDRYEEIRTQFRRATTDCEPKQTSSSGVIRDPVTGEWVRTSESGWIQGSAAACAEAQELDNRLTGVLREYDRLYNEYTLEAMQHGMMLHVVRRQLPIPYRR